ncbi:T7SS effector LXG polymorphic toxin [Bacillus pumilus]|uniref:T7SS effector LXG polymorphic toxin n=1 Tax=Bacillus pumilus TaxID=1408 RepID=UPI00273D7B8D|nr:T7SS effector LXG polymorphic toxin [Bacillus pumilus]WLP59395.1 T7SS effector LXG polymorphic toxin [Bacillus pumilus]
MKTLDAFALINGIDQTLNTLKQQSQQISSIEKQIHHIISLDGALKGEAGQAIRSFYTECHIPFLQFFQVVIKEYSTALKNTKQALNALESNGHGFISQAFIEHELEQGLKKAERMISEIVTDVNHAIGRVGHIVHLPNADESAFQQNYQKAWLETSRTIGLLHAFDREQTSALHETKSSLQTMKQYIHTLSTMFTGPKIDITTYQKGSIFKNGKEEKVSSTISRLKDKIDDPKDNPMMIMLKRLREKERTNVETVVRDESHKNISQQVTANDPSLTTLQREALNGKNKIHRDIRVINGKLYNVKGIKKLKEFDIADEVVTDSSDIDFIGGRYTVYANKQIIRTYIANGEVRIEEVDKIPESRSRGNAKRILDGEVVSTTENIILEYSGIYDGYRAVTGKDPETSQNISNTEQALSAASIIPFMKIIKGGKYVFKINQGKNVVKRVEKSASVTGQVGWSLSKGGGIINQRKYSQHALERMAPNIPEVRATLTKRALKKADELGYQPQTKDFNDFIKKYVDPRDIPPSVIEDAIKNTNKIPGHRKGTFVHDTLDVRVVINEFGDVITVIPK